MKPYNNLPFAIRVRSGGYAEIMVYQEVLNERAKRVDKQYLNTLKELQIETDGVLPDMDLELRPLYFELNDLKYIMPGYQYGENYNKYNNIATIVALHDGGYYLSPLPYDELLIAIDTARIDSGKLDTLNRRHFETAKSFMLSGTETPSLYKEVLRHIEDSAAAILKGLAKAGAELNQPVEDPKTLRKELEKMGMDSRILDAYFPKAKESSEKNTSPKKLGILKRLKVLIDGKV